MAGTHSLHNPLSNPANALMHACASNRLTRRFYRTVVICLQLPPAGPPRRAAVARARAMALIALSDDALGVIFEGLRNVLEPCVAVALSSACHGLLAPTQALRQQLRADHTAAAALCVKVGLRSCKELHEARQLTAASRVTWATRSITAADPQLGITMADIQQHNKASMEEMFLFFTAVDLATLGSLGSVLPVLEELHLSGATCAAGALRLAAGLGAGALPAVVLLDLSLPGIFNDADALAFASAFGAALGRGALPRLKFLDLSNTMMGDAGGFKP